MWICISSTCMCSYVCARANVGATYQRQCLPSLFSILLLREDSPSKPGVLQSSYTGSAENSQDPHFFIFMPYHKPFTQSHPPVFHLEISLYLIPPIKYKIIFSGSHHHSWLEPSGYMIGLYNDHSERCQRVS